jgi:hypothetical protein
MNSASLSPRTRDSTCPKPEPAGPPDCRPVRRCHQDGSRPIRRDRRNEGWDFGPDERTALELTLVDREQSVLYLFQDEAQSVCRDVYPWPQAGMASFVLPENIRNTKAI